MKSCLLALSVVLAFAGTALAAEPKVAETRQANGLSVLRVTAGDGRELAAYSMDLGRHHYPATTADDPLVKKFQSWKYGAFLCFNSNQFSGGEYCTGQDPVRDFRPTALDVQQWVQTIKAAGMNYAVLTVRHTSEFLLWDSQTSEIKVTRSAYGKDLVREYVEECRKQGIEPGIYYCLWGNGWRPNPNARAIILAQLHELATNYGPIPYFWLDMPHRTGWLAKDLSQQEIYDALKNIHPETIVMFNNTIQDGREMKTFPSDVINGEVTPPPVAGHNPVRQVDGKTYYIPFEYEPCSQWRGKDVWFTYGAGKGFEPSQPQSPQKLYRKLAEAYRRGASNVLLSCAPDYSGRFRQDDIEQLIQLGKWLKDPPPASLATGCPATASGTWDENYAAAKAFDGNPETRWGGAKDSKEGWLEVDLGKPATISRATISEGWGRIRKFELQAETNGQWTTIHQGTTIGEDYAASFPPVAAQKIRLRILDAIDVPTIWEFELFK